MDEKQRKLLGVVVIFIGLAMLLFTFYLAYSYLISPYPSPSLPEPQTTATSGQQDISAALSRALAPFFNAMLPLAYSTGYLFIMGLVGFWVMGRGIQLAK